MIKHRYRIENIVIIILPTYSKDVTKVLLLFFNLKKKIKKVVLKKLAFFIKKVKRGLHIGEK